MLDEHEHQPPVDPGELDIQCSMFNVQKENETKITCQVSSGCQCSMFYEQVNVLSKEMMKEDEQKSPVR